MNRWFSHIGVGLVAVGVGYLAHPSGPPDTLEGLGAEVGPTASGEDASGSTELSRAPGVTGVGGIFFKSDDPETLKEWYRI